MTSAGPSHLDLQATAKQIMIEHGFEPDFPPEVPAQLAELRAHPPQLTANANPRNDGEVRDLRQLLWSSIDNDTSRDLDQIEVAEAVTGGTRVLVAVADVDYGIPIGSLIDRHAADQTTTVYTGVKNFSMLPDELSTDLTSLN